MEEYRFSRPIERDVSFSLLINLISSGKKKYVVLKPFVTIAYVDLKKVKHIAKELGVNIKEKKRKQANRSEKPIFSIQIQKLSDVRIVVDKFKGYEFKSPRRKQRHSIFEKALSLVERIGHIHKIWDAEIEKFIELKFELNKDYYYVKRKFSKSDWVDRIKVHLK
jgi:hypothetical protein